MKITRIDRPAGELAGVVGMATPVRLVNSTSFGHQAAGIESSVSVAQPASQVSVSYDREMARYVVKLIDVESGRVVREFPPEEMRRVAEAINRYLGIALDRRS